jgi:hypothetical protein
MENAVRASTGSVSNCWQGDGWAVADAKVTAAKELSGDAPSCIGSGGLFSNGNTMLSATNQESMVSASR